MEKQEKPAHSETSFLRMEVMEVTLDITTRAEEMEKLEEVETNTEAMAYMEEAGVEAYSQALPHMEARVAKRQEVGGVPLWPISLT